MKVEQNRITNIQTVGNIAENVVSIDPKNLEFITHILSSNLYSNPMQSFLRETISNAYDAHREAGNNDPIVLDIGYDNAQLFIRIQDFGTGIGKEKFNAIYRFMGSSTKRESNDYIGSFGIGRFSTLSVSDSAFLTDKHSGIETKYVLYKENMTIKIDEVYSKPTTEHNGLEVLTYLPFNSDTLNSITNSINSLAYFDKLYININIPEPSYDNCHGDYYLRIRREMLLRQVNIFNSRKIKKYKNFSICNILESEPSLCLGSVNYPIDRNVIVIPDYLKHARLQINIPIGSINVTPNREQVLYTNETKDFIQNKISLVDEEIKECVLNKFNTIGDLNTLSDFFEEHLRLELYDSVEVYLKASDLYNYKTEINVFGDNITISQLKYIKQLLNNIQYETYLYKKSYNRRATTQELNISIPGIMRYMRDDRFKNFFIKKEERLQGTVVSWVKDKPDYIIFKNPNLKRIKDIFFKFYNEQRTKQQVNRDVLKGSIKTAIKVIENCNSSMKILNNSTIDEETKALYKRTKTSVPENTISCPYRYTPAGLKQMSCNLLDCFKDKNKLFIYCSNDQLLYAEYLYPVVEYILPKYFKDTYSGLYIIKVAKKDLDLCVDKSNFMPITDFLSKNIKWLHEIKQSIAVFSQLPKDWKNWSSTIRYSLEYTPKLSEKLDNINKFNVCYFTYSTRLTKEGKTFIDSLLENIPEKDIPESCLLTETDKKLIDSLISLTKYVNTNRLADKFIGGLLSTICGYDTSIVIKEMFEQTPILKEYEQFNQNFKVHLGNS